MINNRPILVDKSKKAIHKVRHILEVRRNVIANQNRLLSVPPTKLGDIRRAA